MRLVVHIKSHVYTVQWQTSCYPVPSSQLPAGLAACKTASSRAHHLVHLCQPAGYHLASLQARRHCKLPLEGYDTKNLLEMHLAVQNRWQHVVCAIARSPEPGNEKGQQGHCLTRCMGWPFFRKLTLQQGLSCI